MLKNPEPTQFQIDDAKAIESDAKAAPAKPGDRVNVVLPDGPGSGQIHPADVLGVSENGRVITAQVLGEFLGAENKVITLTLREAPFVSAARLKLKRRLNTWHWPDKK